MTFSTFASFFLAPFMAFSAFFGMGHHATSTPSVASSTATTATSSPIQWPGSNGGVKTSPIVGRNPGGPMIPAPTVPTSALSITSESPKSGPVGTQVTLTGTGFTSASIVHFAVGAVRDVSVSSNGTKLTFTVPSSIGPYCKPDMACAMYMMLVQSGTYAAYVENVPATGDANGPISNTVNFTVTSGSTSSTNLSISGIDAPATLAMTESGTWTVHVTSPSTLQ